MHGVFFLLKLPKSRDWKILSADMEISALFLFDKSNKTLRYEYTDEQKQYICNALM